ncbi:hypothetical protein AB0L00_07630 [Actinoallomurus sp. NPDC052308]|uniref:hypothetical protein n=1 Tax=Actinoallomurus sp. NPDC052308 TaxID=3155530 RepID=UPI00342A018B
MSGKSGTLSTTTVAGLEDLRRTLGNGEGLSDKGGVLVTRKWFTEYLVRGVRSRTRRGGRLVPSAEEVRSYLLRYDRIGQQALPEDQSRELIERVMEMMK